MTRLIVNLNHLGLAAAISGTFTNEKGSNT